MKIKLVYIISTLLVFMLLSFNSEFPDDEFKRNQLSNIRVSKAYEEKIDSIDNLLLNKNLNMNDYEILIRVFKKEEIVELWAKNRTNDTFTFIKNYKICFSSGFLGPKRKQGDKQIPEGVYYINEFNPTSNYHLSLGISYPNKSDSILGKYGNLGGEIYIHGGCESIGCVPITTRKIKELYVIALQARYFGQKRIPVLIFPCKLNETNYKEISQCYNKSELTKFWGNIRSLYTYFDKFHSLPATYIDNYGNYHFSPR